MNEAPNDASQAQLWSRRAVLRRAGLLTASLSILAACGPATTPAAPTSAPAAAPTSAPAAAPTSAPAAAAKPTAPAAAAAPTTAVAAAKPTTAPAAATSAAAPSGTLRYAIADFGNESMDPIYHGHVGRCAVRLAAAI